MLLAGLSAWYTTTVETRPTFTGLPNVVTNAHRGGPGEGLRENSISGAEALLDSGVVDVLDIDTRQLADGTVILMHDECLDRTTDHTGPASNHTAETWRHVMLDTGDHPPEQAPTLAEYLDAIGGRAVITVEAKDSAAVPRMIEIIRTWNLEDSVLINTNDPAVARDIHLAGSLSHLWRSAAQMADEDPQEWIEYVDVLDVDFRGTDAQILAAVESGTPHVWAHTLMTAAQRDRVLKLGVTGVITDYPLTIHER